MQSLVVELHDCLFHRNSSVQIEEIHVRALTVAFYHSFNEAVFSIRDLTHYAEDMLDSSFCHMIGMFESCEGRVFPGSSSSDLLFSTRRY